MSAEKTNGRSGSAPPGKVDIHQIAREARVSIATVSRVINQHASVSAEVRERVQAIIARLSYRPNIIARSLRTQQSGSFGVVIPNVSNAHFADAVRAMQDAAEQSGYTALIANTDNQLEREQAAIRALLARRVDGIVLVSAATKATAALDDALAAGTPLVAMDRRIERVHLDHVLIDTREGTRRAVMHLAAQGRRRIAFIAGPPSLSTAKEKLAGYCDGLKRAGLDDEAPLIGRGDYSFASGAEQATILLAARPRPDAIVAANNLMALGAMRVLLRSTLRIPDDVAFFGVDDTDWTDTIKPSVSVVAQPTASMGREAVTLLLRRIERGAAAAPPEILRLPTSLVLRESTEGEA